MHSRRLPLAALLVAVCIASFTGCNCGARRVVAPPLPPLSRVQITPKTDTLSVGDAHQFVATAVDTDSVAVAGAAFDWSSGDPNVVNVSATGLAQAVGEGVTHVIAAAGGKADTAIVAVIVQPGWYTQPSGTTNDLKGVFFQPDGRSGWAVGNAGTIVATQTAGASWAAVPSGSAFSLNGVWFSTAETGFIVGNGGTVLRTRNAGGSWSRLTSVPASENLFGVCFADSAHGWAVGGSGTILTTTDAGGSWTRANPTAQQLNAVSFSDTTDGWAVGEGGVIVGTHDSGRSWYVFQPSVTSQSLRTVQRLAARSAFAMGAQGAYPFTTSTPDSLQWNLGSVGAGNDMHSLHMVDALVGYAVGTNGSGLVLKTLDGGNVWSPQVSNTAQALTHVWFVDELRGWAVGDAGRILHTAKGGH